MALRPSADDRFGLDMLAHWEKWQRKEGDLAALAVRLSRRNPLASLRHVLTSTSYLWRITGRAGLDTYYTVAFVPGKSAKYQKLRDFHVSGDENVDWVEPKVPLPGVVDWTFRNTWLFWRPALYLYLILFSLAIAMLREGIDAVCAAADSGLAADRLPGAGGVDTGVPLPVSDLHDRAAVRRVFPVLRCRATNEKFVGWDQRACERRPTSAVLVGPRSQARWSHPTDISCSASAIFPHNPAEL